MWCSSSAICSTPRRQPPSPERIVYAALLALAQTGATVVVLAGNHDSDRRLQAVAPLLELGHVVTRPVFAAPRHGRRRRVVHSRSARTGAAGVRAVPVPALGREGARSPRPRRRNASTAIQRAHAHARRAHSPPASPTPTPSICSPRTAWCSGPAPPAANAWARPCSNTRSPRTPSRPACSTWHSGTCIANRRCPAPVPIHYPGSPLQLDFGEVNDIKGVLIIDVHPWQAGDCAAGGVERRSSTPRDRRQRWLNSRPALDTGDDWLKVVVHEKSRPGLADEVSGLLPNAVDVAVASLPASNLGSSGPTTHRTLAARAFRRVPAPIATSTAHGLPLCSRELLDAVTEATT